MLGSGKALGISSCWVGAFEDATDLNRLFNLPDTLIPLIVLPVGYPAGKTPPQRPRLAREDILIEPEIKN
jgi:nitroreductase